MSGADILYWLGDIWYDVTHLGTADIPSLIFRLLVLLAALVIGQHVVKTVLRILWDICKPIVHLIRDILWGIWWVVSAPVRVPLGWIRKGRQAREKRQQARRWEMQQQRDEQREQDQIAAQIRAQNEEYQRMKGMMNKLE